MGAESGQLRILWRQCGFDRDTGWENHFLPDPEGRRPLSQCDEKQHGSCETDAGYDGSHYIQCFLGEVVIIGGVGVNGLLGLVQGKMIVFSGSLHFWFLLCFILTLVYKGMSPIKRTI